jgi:excisionase family DNA binding protein
MTTTTAPTFATLAQAAERYGIAVKTLRRAIWDGQIPYMKVGGQYRVDLDELDLIFYRPADPDADTSERMSLPRPQRAQRQAVAVADDELDDEPADGGG